MSAICILAPFFVAAGPAFVSAVNSAAKSLGYTVARELHSASLELDSRTGHVEIELNQSELVSDSLGRDQRISFTGNQVSITFSRDARGHASFCVVGKGHTDAELRLLGERFSQCVVQQYVYQRLTDEMHSRGYNVVQEEVDENQAIRLKVRHWEN